MRFSEMVGWGHPDKMADYVSDLVLEHILNLDANAKVACEVMLVSNTLIVAGEYKTTLTLEKQDNLIIEFKQFIKNELFKIGQPILNVKWLMQFQSPDITQAVEKVDTGAGDQAIVFGYATHETPSMLPYEHWYTNTVRDWLIGYVKSGHAQGHYGYDFKVLAAFTDDLKLQHLTVSIQHAEQLTQVQIESDISRCVTNIHGVYNIQTAPNYTISINPSGRFVIGGSYGDTGLTGRKLMVDTYGGSASHGGGAFSGKDATKVDRSGAYLARYIAKHLVYCGWYDNVQVGLLYEIGNPNILEIDLKGKKNTVLFSDDQIKTLIRDCFPMTVRQTIKELMPSNLKYSETALNGAFWDQTNPWEVISDGTVGKLLNMQHKSA